MRYPNGSYSIDPVAVGGKYPGAGQSAAPDVSDTGVSDTGVSGIGVSDNGYEPPADPLQSRVEAVWQRIEAAREEELYYYLQPVDEIDGAWVGTGNGSIAGRKLMFATYSYLGLLRHPRVVAAAEEALARYGAGTHGVRLLGGSLDLHDRLEQRIATFTGAESAIAFSSGYVTNLATISTLTGRGDWIISDRWNHASIVDGCRLSQAQHKRFRHNDMDALERILSEAPPEITKLVVADAVFSMDGDIFNLPRAVELCRHYGARLMIDEAHSLGVLGPTGRGIEEYYGMPGSVDIKMGTLSKTIPGIGGYIAGDAKLINYLRHTARGFIFSAALPPSVSAAAAAAFDVIDDEGPDLLRRLEKNVRQFVGGLRDVGFDTGVTCTPIVPILVYDEQPALEMTRFCQQHGLFVLPALPPAVPEGSARLRANVTAAHSAEDIAFALEIFADAGRACGVL